MVLLAAAETVTSPGWWQQAVSVLVTIGAPAGALWAILRYVRPIRRFWMRRKERRDLERLAAQKAVVAEALAPFGQRMSNAERLSTVRHEQNQREIQEIGRQVSRVQVSQKLINERIDRHMDEEREERKTDRSELLGYLSLIGQLRREDVQRLRDRRPEDGPAGDGS